MGPQAGLGSFTAVLCLFLCFLAGGDSSQDEAEDDVKQITVCPHFPFYAGSGNCSWESLTIQSEMKGQQTSASPADPGLGGGGQVDSPLLHGHKDGTESKRWFIGARAPSLLLIHQINKADEVFFSQGF